MTPTPSSRHLADNMPAPNGVNRCPVSAAILTDPRAMNQHLANGIPHSSHSKSSTPPPRQTSEPLLSRSSLLSPSNFDIQFPTRSSKDDAYHVFEGKGKKPSTAGNEVNNEAYKIPSSGFNPRALLDPKSFAKTKHSNGDENSLSPNVTFTTSKPSASPREPTSNGSHPPICDSIPRRDYDEYEGHSISSLIERVHNVSERAERPPKRRKIEKAEDEVAFEEQKKANFGGGGKGGEIGDYMKQKKKEGLAESGPTSSVVDLTGGDDDEIVLVSDSQDREVCYGRVEHARVLAHQVPCPSGKAVYLSKGDWPAIKLQLKRLPGKDNIVRVIDAMGKDFGNVDLRTAYALTRIIDSKNLKFRTQARLNMRKRKPDDYPGKECSEYFEMTLNLYGPKSKAVMVGRLLSQKQTWLRTPVMSDAGIEICNPHQPAVASPKTCYGHAGSSSGGPGAGYVTRTVEEIRSDVIGMFDSLEKSENMPEMDPDARVSTKLLSHQKQGLYFMTNKERARVFSDNEEDNNSLWRLKLRPSGQRMYYNVITGQEEREKPPEVLGGILADMMGLGKTLSILSLIVGSLEEAKQWANQPCPQIDGTKLLTRSSKTTLLVSPLSTVANWEDQIAHHIQPGTLKYYIYHGGNRTSSLDELGKYDIVITTYSIVASEYLGRGKKTIINPLLQTNFFRIVLDEAHMIREQSTKQSQAICALSAQRRWAVTGTPVQNRLDDLGALIKFLRIKPFNEKGGFAQYILAPFKNADPEILPKLRLLVDSITLRRLKDRIDLPGRHDKIVRLSFNDEERNLYEWFAKDSQNKLKIIASDQKKSLGGKTYAHILRAIMRLRLICAHGRELLSEDDLKITEGFSSDNAISIEDDDEENKPALSPRQAYEMLMLLRETNTDTCVQCAHTVEANEENPSEKDEVIGCMLPCFQIVCRDCMEGVKGSIERSSSAENCFKCPFCDQILTTSFFALTKEGIEQAEELRAKARENPRQAKVMGRYGGPHTKVKALIENLQKSIADSMSLPTGEQPIKSVVFSGWTANLDLIQIALEDNNIKYVRLDGRMSRKNRNASLDAFRDDPNYCVILISITAGGLGLNLTSGSNVYVMEPQFNPAAEAQAVDRVHRLGQKREVFTYRYIMDDSFEEKMLELQRKKQNLADLSMNRGKLDKAEAAKRKMDELRSLFK